MGRCFYAGGIYREWLGGGVTECSWLKGAPGAERYRVDGTRLDRSREMGGGGSLIPALPQVLEEGR